MEQKEGNSTPVLRLDKPFNGDIYQIGDDIRISDTLDLHYPFPHSFLLRDFMIIYLRKGSISGSVNGVKTHYQAPCMISIQPDNTHRFEDYLPGTTGTIISFSAAFTERLNLLNRFQLMDLLLHAPSIPLDNNTQKQLKEYISQLLALGKNPGNPFMDEALTHLTLSFFYSFGYQYYQTSMRYDRSREIADGFMQLAETYGAEERRMSFYSEKMHLSIKYIQSMVSKVTGRSAYAWIEDAVIRKAKQLLSDNSITIQQIAFQLRFRDQSYFAAYFKRVTGMTPKKFRTKTIIP